MKDKKQVKIIILIIAIIAIVICTILYFNINNKKEIQKISQDVQEKYEEMKENSVMYNNETTLEELKEEYKFTGSNDIYEIETELDGRNVINVKSNMNFKVAFCGMIKKEKPTYEELDSIYDSNYPQRSGIWINKDSRERILNYLNTKLGYTYNINEEGYLEIKGKSAQSDVDMKMEKLINGEKQYILDISSVYYMIDAVTGEIVDNPYNDLEEYQTYDYCEDENKMIIFVSKNIDSKLNEDEIFESVLNLIPSHYTDIN